MNRFPQLCLLLSSSFILLPAGWNLMEKSSANFLTMDCSGKYNVCRTLKSTCISNFIYHIEGNSIFPPKLYLLTRFGNIPEVSNHNIHKDYFEIDEVLYRLDIEEGYGFLEKVTSINIQLNEYGKYASAAVDNNFNSLDHLKKLSEKLNKKELQIGEPQSAISVEVYSENTLPYHLPFEIYDQETGIAQHVYLGNPLEEYGDIYDTSREKSNIDTYYGTSNDDINDLIAAAVPYTNYYDYEKSRIKSEYEKDDELPYEIPYKNYYYQEKSTNESEYENYDELPYDIPDHYVNEESTNESEYENDDELPYEIPYKKYNYDKSTNESEYENYDELPYGIPDRYVNEESTNESEYENDDAIVAETGLDDILSDEENEQDDTPRKKPSVNGLGKKCKTHNWRFPHPEWKDFYYQCYRYKSPRLRRCKKDHIFSTLRRKCFFK